MRRSERVLPLSHTSPTGFARRAGDDATNILYAVWRKPRRLLSRGCKFQLKSGRGAATPSGSSRYSQRGRATSIATLVDRWPAIPRTTDCPDGTLCTREARQRRTILIAKHLTPQGWLRVFKVEENTQKRWKCKTRDVGASSILAQPAEQTAPAPSTGGIRRTCCRED